MELIEYLMSIWWLPPLILGAGLCWLAWIAWPHIKD